MNKTIYSQQSECLRTTLVKMRTEAGLTQRQLAERMNREHSLISRLELGERRLDFIELVWLCKACDANPDKVIRQLLKKFEEMAAKQSS